ncbi:dipeptide ABC transporter ATP-binding protein [Microlunatus sp. GCM10028923]|uniref:dipeptide ABC transporter ATP-binding protein n=1 Tax=Microlunatus sp. GCM10028923 TaxID=3273400 RepID=UPI003610F490
MSTSGTAAGVAVQVANLSVTFGAGRRLRTVVRNLSFEIADGEALALVGESGSGKSVTARTLVGLTGAGSRVTADALRFGGEDLTRYSGRDWRRLRGARIGFVLQDALASLDGLRPVGREIAEPLALHTDLSKSQRQARVIELLASVGVPEPEVRAKQYPHQLSGGLRQRALIASALGAGPDFLIADEPTTALDTTIQKQILDLFGTLKEDGRAMLVVSHDLAVVARIADRVAVMRSGEIVETGSVEAVLQDPRHPYTKALLAAVPSAHTRGTRLAAASLPEPVEGQTTRSGPALRQAQGTEVRQAQGTEVRRAQGAESGPVIEVRDVIKTFDGPDGDRRTAVDGVSFTVAPGETLGLVGESGSGKTTAARIVLGLERPDQGQVLIKGRSWSDLSRLDRRRTHRSLGVIYQDPLSSFDPRYPVGRVIGEAIGRGPGRRDRRRRVAELLDQVGLDAGFHDRRPIELSGGERQRVAIARALAPRPDVIVCDEPVSALDVSVQAQVLDLLVDLQSELGLAYLFISHDLGVVHHLADRVVVLKDGSVVEHGDVETIFTEPQAEYTRLLLSAIPRLDTTPKEAPLHA